MAEPVWDVLSVRDGNGEPLLGSCTLIVGDTAVVFDRGVSRVPESIARLLVSNPRVRIPGFKGSASPSAGDEKSGDAVDTDGPDDPDVEAQRREDLEDQLREDAAVLGDAETTKPTPGKDALTADGHPRCQALKADGTQCANAATNDRACGLASHQAQLA